MKWLETELKCVIKEVLVSTPVHLQHQTCFGFFYKKSGQPWYGEQKKIEVSVKPEALCKEPSKTYIIKTLMDHTHCLQLSVNGNASEYAQVVKYYIEQTNDPLRMATKRITLISTVPGLLLIILIYS